MAAQHAERTRRGYHTRQDQRVPMEDVEQRTSRPWVRVPSFSLTLSVELARLTKSLRGDVDTGMVC